MPVDELDILLFEELKADARHPVRALARKLGLKRSTIRYRLDRLISEGTLRILCKSNTRLLGYSFSNVIGLRTRADRNRTVADQLASLPAVKHICLMAGRYNIMAWAVYRDESEIVNFISEELADISDISSMEIMPIFQRLKAFFQKKEATSTGDKPVQMDDLDLSLIGIMEQNPRQTIKNIAQTIGCSQALARNRLNKLINDGMIWLFPIIDPTVISGAANWLLILIKPELDRVSAVTGTLSSFKKVVDMSLIEGQWQLIVTARMLKDQPMCDSLSDVLGSVPGIKEFEVLHVLKAVKFSSLFL